MRTKAGIRRCRVNPCADLKLRIAGGQGARGRLSDLPVRLFCDPFVQPFSKKYFLGGATSLRGWGRFEVSPVGEWIEIRSPPSRDGLEKVR